MCYDIKASLEAQLNRARRRNDEKAIKEIIKNLVPLSDLPLYHASGFQHPTLFIYTNRSKNIPELSTWGLVPSWIKDSEQKSKFWNNTINARGETIFEKPSFKQSAKNNRCLIYVDGFYEHHHFQGNTYPFFIYNKDLSPLTLAGLYNEWTNQATGEVLNTFSIVTTVGNHLLSKIHNNPKIKGPRMPLILPVELEDKWLTLIDSELDQKEIQELIREYPDEELTSHPVRKIRGKSALGNVEQATNECDYPELAFADL